MRLLVLSAILGEAGALPQVGSRGALLENLASGKALSCGAVVDSRTMLRLCSILLLGFCVAVQCGEGLQLLSNLLLKR